MDQKFPLQYWPRQGLKKLRRRRRPYDAVPMYRVRKSPRNSPNRHPLAMNRT